MVETSDKNMIEMSPSSWVESQVNYPWKELPRPVFSLLMMETDFEPSKSSTVDAIFLKQLVGLVGLVIPSLHSPTLKQLK